MKEKIIALMQKNGLTKIKLINLIDMGDCYDEDGEPYPIVANTLEIKDGKLYCYDDNYEDNDGNVSFEYWYEVNSLDNRIQMDCFSSLERALLS